MYHSLTKFTFALLAVALSTVTSFGSAAGQGAEQAFRIADIRWPEPRLPEDYKPKPLTTEQATALEPGDKFRECDQCPELIVLPPISSAQEPKSKISSDVRSLSRIAIGRFEVTFAEWAGCVAHANCRYIENFHREPNTSYPVSTVSRIDAETYATWLSYLTGRRYRLPTGSEWDHAANVAGIENDATRTSKSVRLIEHAWFAANSDGHAHPVGKKSANKFGLHDMFGNVWEWTSGCFHGADAPGMKAANKDDNENCEFGVRRGGSWFSSAQYLEPNVRLKMSVNGRVDDVGFRIVREIESDFREN